MQKLFFFSLLYCSFLSCNAQTATDKNAVGILCYNVENLYDTIDDPLIDDKEFLPASDKQWNNDRYQTKIEHLAKVIGIAADELPAIIGLVEIENESVLLDLVKAEDLKAANYGIIHFDSPDERGIDVALLYNKNIFTPELSHPIPVDLHIEPVDHTRDILYVKGKMRIGGKTEELHIFVNHWPSRSEGEEVSAPKRAAAALTLKNTIDSVLHTSKNAQIIIMGDFNDTPYDKSITQILEAKENAQDCKNNCLVDLMSTKQKNNEGSYNYKGNWQALDQFIVSSNLLDNKSLEADTSSLEFVKKDFMLYHSEKYGDAPNRTFSGPVYHAGYSDHLPIYMRLIFK